MKIAVVLPGFSLYDGCIHYRNYMPSLKLQEKGHKIDMVILGPNFNRDGLLKCDLVVFSRYYPMDISNLILFLKRNKIKIVYEADDDLLNIPNTNPTKQIIEQFLESIAVLGNEADLITTTTSFFAKTLQSRYPNKPIEILPNSIDFNELLPRPRKSETLRIGWTGGVTHCVDLALLMEGIKELQDKYDFTFVGMGITANPIECQAFDWEKSCELGLADPNNPFMKTGLEFVHKFSMLKKKEWYPFYPSAMYPQMLTRLDLDISLAPVSDNVFSRSKSCLKYYEYAASESLTLASNLLPYTTEITQSKCLVGPSIKDWVDSIEYFIINKEERDIVQKEQTAWVKENRDINKTISLWEKAYEKVLGI